MAINSVNHRVWNASDEPLPGDLPLEIAIAQPEDLLENKWIRYSSEIDP